MLPPKMKMKVQSAEAEPNPNQRIDDFHELLRDPNAVLSEEVLLALNKGLLKTILSPKLNGIVGQDVRPVNFRLRSKHLVPLTTYIDRMSKHGTFCCVQPEILLCPILISPQLVTRCVDF
jgi:hypothetical protein